jgi:thymidylate kinase
MLADHQRTTGERYWDVWMTLLWGVKLKANLRPQRGILITLSGIDGSGKTAQAEQLIEAMRTCGIQTGYFWRRGGSTGLLGLLGRLRGQATPAGSRSTGQASVTVDSQAMPPVEDSLSRRRRRLSHPALRLAWSWLVVADQVAAYTLGAWLPTRLGLVIVCDRYAFDTAIEMAASLPPDDRTSRLAIDWLLRLAPRPELAYLLDVSAETARQRKPDEVWHAEIEHERERYLELARQHGLRLLSTEGALADSNDRLVRETIMHYMIDIDTWLGALFLGNPGQKNRPDGYWARGGAR